MQTSIRHAAILPKLPDDIEQPFTVIDINNPRYNKDKPQKPFTVDESERLYFVVHLDNYERFINTTNNFANDKEAQQAVDPIDFFIQERLLPLSPYSDFGKYECEVFIYFECLGFNFNIMPPAHRWVKETMYDALFRSLSFSDFKKEMEGSGADIYFTDSINDQHDQDNLIGYLPNYKKYVINIPLRPKSSHLLRTN